MAGASTDKPSKKKKSLGPADNNIHLGSERASKYGCNKALFNNLCTNTNVLLPNETDSLCNAFENLLLHSVSNSTWKKHGSAWNSLEQFHKKFNMALNLPIDTKTARAYTTWALSEKNLQPSTIESYLSSIMTVQKISGYNCENFSSDKCIQLLLKGGENVLMLRGKRNPSRLAMNKYLLRVFGHKISVENWDDMSKQVLWTASVVSFYTSCRMGEIVPTSKHSFDSSTTLKWQNVKFVDDNEAIIFLPCTKSTGLRGAFIDIFPIKSDSTCPYAALKKLKDLNLRYNTYNEKNPVFRFKSGTFLTTEKMNEILDSFLSNFTDANHKISCHSFRAAIPSAMASHPDSCTAKEIQEWGQWHSDSFERYTRLERDKKRKLFYKSIALL